MTNKAILIAITCCLFISMGQLQHLQAQIGEIIWEETIDFESPYVYLTTDSIADNLWQIGTPSKLLLNQALSPELAILTDTANFYPNDSYAYFDIAIGSFNMPHYEYQVFLDFKHKYHTDTLADGGYLTFSFDNGETWLSLQEAEDFWWYCGFNVEQLGFYTPDQTLVNGMAGFSGTNTSEWTNSYFTWHLLPVLRSSDSNCFPDTTIIRFNFVSDSTDNSKEGWMIDDLRLYAVDLGSNIKEYQPLAFNIAPNPSSNFSRITFDEVKNNIHLHLYNAHGQRVYTNNYHNRQSVDLNTQHLPTGLYQIQLQLDNTYRTSKSLIITH